jgi:uncharacterized protein YyaL (SSP411 family)
VSLRPEGHKPPQEVAAICWQPWDAPAFVQAQEENKPILLSIGAVWCYWCQVMDEHTYTDPDVAAYVNKHFVPVRVDNDHRPDINARYNVGGWPSTVFLTGHGGSIAGATYLPPDQLLAMLMEVQRAYAEQKVALYDQGNSLLRQRQEQVARISADAEVDDRLVDRIGRRAVGTYDARFGGFGEEPKFPGVPILQLMLHLFRTTGEEFYRIILEKTLDNMVQGRIYDHEEGGFFRYSPRADWSEAQHEKMLEDNIGLAGVFLDAYLLLDNEGYGHVASRTIDFLLSHLYDGEAAGFRGSQGAHSDYFGLPPELRQQQPAPAPDPYCYTHWSAQAASLLLEASWRLQRPDLDQPALRVLNALDSMEQSGGLPHVYNSNGPVEHSGGALLADQAHLLNALMDRLNHTSADDKYLRRAKKVAGGIIDRFFDSANGGFFDIEGIEGDAEPLGYLKVREKPLPENVVAARGLLKLYQATGDDAYLGAVHRTLSAFVEANGAYGEFAAGYAVAVDLFLNRPLEITVEGHPQSNETHAMLRAAAKVPYPHLVIKPVATDIGLPVRAHICLDTVCLPPVGDPNELAKAVAEAVSPQESPFENVFESFAGF